MPSAESVYSFMQTPNTSPTVVAGMVHRALLTLNSLYVFTDPERWTNIPLLVKIFKLIINELSTVVEANASRANAADWSQGKYNRL